jgi:hypothetical protein
MLTTKDNDDRVRTMGNPAYDRRGGGRSNEVAEARRYMGGATPMGEAAPSRDVAGTRGVMGREQRKQQSENKARDIDAPFRGAAPTVSPVAKHESKPVQTEAPKTKTASDDDKSGFTEKQREWIAEQMSSVAKATATEMAREMPSRAEVYGEINAAIDPRFRSLTRSQGAGTFVRVGAGGGFYLGSGADDSGGAAMSYSDWAFGFILNPDGDNPAEVQINAGEIDRIAVSAAKIVVADDGYVYIRRTISNNTMLIATAASVPANDATYLYYRLYQFTVTSGVASVKLVLRPLDIEGGAAGFTGTVTVITSMQYASNSLQYKTKLLTYTNGLLTTVGTESDWVTLFTAVTGCP